MNLFQNDMNKEILLHLSNGLTLSDIAKEIYRSRHAVKKRLAKMREEADVKNNNELISYAHKNNLLSSKEVT